MTIYSEEDRKQYEKEGKRDFVREAFERRAKEVGDEIRRRLGLEAEVTEDISCEVVGSFYEPCGLAVQKEDRAEP